jgi:hypothetical protein
LAVHNGFLYAATNAGVWKRSLSELTGVATTAADIPYRCFLEQNYPNPCASETIFTFGLPRSGHASLSIIDMAGRLLATLVDGYFDPGAHRAAWSVPTMPSGMYACVLHVGATEIARTFVVGK